MVNQPNSNNDNPNTSPPKREIPPTGNSIVVSGNVSFGGNVGSGSVTVEQMAGHDLIVNGTMIDNQGQFASLLADLHDLLIKAKDAGELPEQLAREVFSELESAKELVKEGDKPPKQTLIQKLQRVAQLIDNALDTLDASRSPAAMLLKALPFAALLIRVASQLF